MRGVSLRKMFLTAGVLGALTALEARAQGARQVVHTDASGMWVETEIGNDSGVKTPPPARPRGGEIVWHAHTEYSLTSSVCLSDATDESWVAHEGSNERLAYHQTTGDGTAIWEFDVSDEDPSHTVEVASAESVSLGLLTVKSRVTNRVSIRAFDETSGPEPIWIYEFEGPYDSSGGHGVDVSADGSLVAGVAYRDGSSEAMVVILDGATGTELRRLLSESVTDVELCDDGSRAILTRNAVARVIDTSTMSIIHTFQVWGGGSPHRISRDGTVVAGGAGDFEAHRETDGVWEEIYYIPQGSYEWFGAGIGLSEHGDTLFLATHTYQPDYLTLTYRVIDLVAGEELTSFTATGTGSYQDPIQWAVSSDDGEVFAVASWGTEFDDHPEVQIFDRELNLIGSINTPGSPFSIDMTRDGRYVLVGGKAVHANEMGRGSDTYVYRIAGLVGDIDGDGDVDLADLAALLAAYGLCAGDPGYNPDADFDESGCVDLADLAALLANYGA